MPPPPFFHLCALISRFLKTLFYTQSKRNFFSTLLHRASGGSASNPGSPGTSLMANGLRSTNDHGSNHPSTPQLYPSPRLNPLSSVSNPQRRLSRSFSDSTHGQSSLKSPFSIHLYSSFFLDAIRNQAADPCTFCPCVRQHPQPQIHGPSTHSTHPIPTYLEECPPLVWGNSRQ